MNHWETRIALVITLFLAAVPQEVSAAAPTTIDLVGSLLVKGRAPKTAGRSVPSKELAHMKYIV